MADFIEQRRGRFGATPMVRDGIRGAAYGSRTAQLGDALFGLMRTSTALAEQEGQKAYEEGVKARLNDVERENSNDATRGLFAPLFRQRAYDGFDYQDAQFDAATIAMEEQVGMYEALKDSTNPADFEAWSASRDAALGERLGEKSDVYRTAMAERMMRHRESQASTFGNWVIQNRERKAREAARASAKAEAMRVAGALEVAASEAFSGLNPETDLSAYIQEFTDGAPSAFGISHAEARAIAFEEAINYAEQTNNFQFLDSIDPKSLTRDQRADLGKTRHTVLTRQNAVESFNEAKAKAEAAAIEKQVVDERNRVLMQGFEATASGASPAEIAQDMMNLQYYKDNPEKLVSDVSNLESIYTGTHDPVLEALAVGEFEQEVVDTALAGGDPMAVLVDYMGNIRSPAARKAAAELVSGMEKAIEDRIFEPTTLRQRESDFTSLFANQAPKDSPAAQLGLTDPTPAQVGFVTEAMQDYRSALLEYHRDWYRENPEGRLGRAQRIEIERSAFQEVRDMYERRVISMTEINEQSEAANAVSRLRAIVEGQ